MVVDLEVTQDFWHEITDFGVTVFDSGGRRISDGPVDYAVGRQVVEIDSSLVGELLEVELLPAFARADASMDWSAYAKVSFLTDEPVALPQEVPASADGVPIVPSGSVLVAFTRPSAELPQPDGFLPLIEIEAKPHDGVPALRRAPVRWHSVGAEERMD
jgi:hypothetical protein